MITAIWLVVAAVLGAAAMALWLLQRGTSRDALLATENDRLRALASERADRVSMLSHEIRTPLALVKGAAELLADGVPGPLTEPQQEFVGTIAINCEHMIALSEDLLTEARLEAGLFRLQLERVDIRSLARGVVSDLRGLYRNTLMLDAPRAPRRIPADPQLIRQVLVNLVTNAIRHAGSDAAVTVRITDGEDSVVIAVSDDGAGMDSYQRARLFTRDAAQQIDADAMNPGTGIGLIISKRIVALHGGRLFVDTIPHRGTTMIFTLPATSAGAMHAGLRR